MDCGHFFKALDFYLHVKTKIVLPPTPFGCKQHGRMGWQGVQFCILATLYRLSLFFKWFHKKNDLLIESRETIEGLQDGTRNIPDMADRASEETDRALELRTRDRQRKLVSKIDAALRRIDEGEYGYCDVTGEPISLKRLNARPIATMSLEAQERHERREKVHRDD